MSIEKMADFFMARVDGYDDHMINEVNGCKEGYIKMAQLIPPSTSSLLDLGCGTGLELDEIFKINPSLAVTGIDLTQAMLDKLKEKHPDKNLVLINASYFDWDFGNEKFETAVSFQTMHHFSHADKLKLYTKILKSLTQHGKYIECDYMVTEQKDEDFYYSENARLRKELNVSDDEFYHYDTPCTIENQINLMLKSGFKKAEVVWSMESTNMIIASKD